VDQNTRSQVSNNASYRPASRPHSEQRVVSLDQSSVATYATQDPRSATISSTNTPQSDYGLPPSSARSSGFPPEHLRYSQYPQAPHQAGAVVTMAQPSSPSKSLPEDSLNGNHVTNSHHVRSNSDVPIDPSISQASPTYPPYSPYPPQQGMDHAYQPQHPPYMQQRPPHDQWGGYPQHGMPAPYPHPGPGVQGPPQTSAASRSGQVCSHDLHRRSSASH
jgi:transcription factor CON7